MTLRLRSPVSIPGGRTGAALVFVVLLLLAVVGLGHGMLAASLGELAASRAVVRNLGARVAAEGAVQIALREPGGLWLDTVPVGGESTLPTRFLAGALATPRARRLARESWLVDGEGSLPGRVPARSARLAWALDPIARVAALGGVITVGPDAPVTLHGPTESGAPTGVVAPMSEADCAPWLHELEVHYAGSPLGAVATLSDTVGAPRLGLQDFAALFDLMDATVGGAGTPAPVERLGICETEAPWNWGDPLQPRRPCGTHVSLRASSGDLVVTGGVGQGILMVDGALTLTSGALYYGLVLTRGPLTVADGAALEGLVVALGGVELDATSRVRGSACWAARALASHRARLGRLIPLVSPGVLGPL